MLKRRTVFLSSLAGLALAGGICLQVRPARAASPEQDAAAFVEQTGKQLTQIVNGPGSLQEKQAAMQKIIDRTVDVAGVARFCLGRFWRQATPAQQQQYVDLFHRVLMINITGKIGEYQGVSFAVGHAAPREGAVAVSTTVNRPGVAPANVDWIVEMESDGPKIVDVVAEGTSLRLTQRSDYASYISRNGNSVQALIDALRHQASQSG